MGEFTSGLTHDQQNFTSTQNPDVLDAGKVQTDVEGVFADGKKGDCPIFSVTKEEFYNNMRNDRKRLRFKTEPAANYLRGSRYNQPFFIQYKDDASGEHFLRKVK